MTNLRPAERLEAALAPDLMEQGKVLAREMRDAGVPKAMAQQMLLELLVSLDLTCADTVWEVVSRLIDVVYAEGRVAWH